MHRAVFLQRLPVILTLLAFTATAANADEAQCMAAVQNKHYERLSTVCIDLPHRDRLKKIQLMMSGEYTHSLGSVAQPSAAFTALKELADTGDHQAQYMYGLLYSTVHLATDFSWPQHAGNDGSIALEDYNAGIYAEANRWAQLAADGGHTLAMLDVAEQLLRESYANTSTDLAEALRMARRSRVQNHRLAKDLIARLHKRIREIEAGKDDD